MLRVEPTHDKEILNRLHGAIFGVTYPKDIGFLLYYKDTAVGIADIKADAKESEIIAIGIVPEERGKGWGDFLTRVIMDRLTTVSQSIYVRYKSDYFVKFGFREEEGGMRIESKDIKFPSKCRS